MENRSRPSVTARRVRRSRHPGGFLVAAAQHALGTPRLLMMLLALVVLLVALVAGTRARAELITDARTVKALAALLTPTPTPSPTPLPDKVLYLTFDDGPDPAFTPQILDVLAQHNAKATFFILGRSAYSFFDLVERAHGEGHGIANHSWNHTALRGMDQATFHAEVIGTQELLGPLASACLRPPYGVTDATSEAWAAQSGLRLVGWEIDSNDWQTPDAAQIADAIVSQAHDGAIVLLHDGGGDRSHSVNALSIALPELASMGYRFEAVCR